MERVVPTLSTWRPLFSPLFHLSEVYVRIARRRCSLSHSYGPARVTRIASLHCSFSLAPHPIFHHPALSIPAFIIVLLLFVLLLCIIAV